MAELHCVFNTNLSKEVGRLREWSESVFPRRYRHMELSKEAEVELARLKYVLSQGCKEGLVSSPLDWPGPSAAWALVSGEPLIGEWVDRTALRRALDRGEEVEEADFTEEVEVVLSPIPSLAHLSTLEYRRVMRDLVKEIEEETAAMHRVDGTRPVGVDRILSQDPHEVVGDGARMPCGGFFASDSTVRRAMTEALVFIYVSYREAAERLKGGDRSARFPVHTFPPGLPFVENSMAPRREVEILEPG